MKELDNFRIECKSWNDCFLLNIDVIDNQHLELFQIFEKILDNSKKCDYIDVVIELLEELEIKAKLHFETEEKLLSAAGYPELDIHTKQHIYLVNQVKYYQNTFKYCNLNLIDQLNTFIRKWILNHIHIEDAKFKTIIQSHIEKEINNWII